jgi:hypothetical protein
MWPFKKERIYDGKVEVERLEFKDGQRYTYLKGAKYPMRGVSRSSVLKLLYPFKKSLLNMLTKELNNLFPHEVPQEELTEPVKEIARVFDLLIEAEEYEGMKNKWRMIKRGICMFLEEDDAYRYRVQWAVEKLNRKKIKLTKEDKYYFRTKHFRVDD